MKVVFLSYWRNDADRQLAQRIRHLLAKTDIWKWLWIVGDSEDETEGWLRAVAPKDVEVLRADTGIVGEDIDTRRVRISLTETMAYRHLASAQYADADFICQHESDLRSPVDVATRMSAFLDRPGHDAIAGWPTLALEHETVFYDLYGMRGLDGVQFGPYAPYHSDYRPDAPFEVSSVGSVWMAPAKAWHGKVIQTDCCVELCAQWRQEGLRVFVDPTLPIEQPRDLWVLS